MVVIGLLLAAGEGSRFGGDKLLAPLAGERIGVLACRNLLAAIPDVVAVVRPHDAALSAALEAAGARVIVCDDAGRGIGASLAFGVRATIDASGWVIALADMPWIRPDTIALVARAIGKGAPLAAPFHRGARGHPVGFASAYAAELSALDGDEGAKSVIARSASAMTRIDVDDPGVLRDIDVPGDLVGQD